MKFEARLKVYLLGAAISATNLVLAAEGSNAGKAVIRVQAYQAKLAPVEQVKTLEVKPAAVAKGAGEKPLIAEPVEIRVPALKEEVSPVEQNNPVLELKGVRG